MRSLRHKYGEVYKSAARCSETAAATSGTTAAEAQSRRTVKVGYSLIEEESIVHKTHASP